MVRHEAGCPSGDLGDRLGGDTGELLREVLAPVRAPDERLLEVNRIVDDADDGQDVAVPDDVFGDRRAIAGGHAVALDPAGLYVGGDHGQHRAVPAPGGETRPGVGVVLGRMRTAVHPDHPDVAAACPGAID